MMGYGTFTIFNFLFSVLEASVLVRRERAGTTIPNLTDPPARLFRRDEDTTLIIFGTRDANRNPEAFFNDTERNWGQEGPMELNEFGVRQAGGLGDALRVFAGRQRLHGPSLIHRKRAQLFTSSANHCRQTMKIAAARLFCTRSLPVLDDDPMLRMHSISNCTTSNEAWAPISDDTLPSLLSIAVNNSNLLEYMRNSTGWNTSLSMAADVADNLAQIKLFNASYPDWIEHPTLSGYDKDMLIAMYKTFQEIHQYACAEYEPCRNIMAGVWLAHILNVLDAANDPQSPTIVGYSSHAEITLALMKLLGIQQDTLEMASGFLIEYKPNPPSVRLLTHAPFHIDGHLIKEPLLDPILSLLEDSSGFIPLDAFKNFTSPYEITNWQEACGIDAAT